MTWTITEAKADWTAVQQTVINTQLQLVTSTEANALNAASKGIEKIEWKEKVEKYAQGTRITAK